MKNTNKCPKCGSSNIIKIKGDKTTHGNTILTGMTVLSAVSVERYLCCDCGYSEEWIDKEDIEKVKRKFG